MGHSNPITIRDKDFAPSACRIASTRGGLTIHGHFYQKSAHARHVTIAASKANSTATNHRRACRTPSPIAMCIPDMALNHRTRNKIADSCGPVRRPRPHPRHICRRKSISSRSSETRRAHHNEHELHMGRYTQFRSRNPYHPPLTKREMPTPRLVRTRHGQKDDERHESEPGGDSSRLHSKRSQYTAVPPRSPRPLQDRNEVLRRCESHSEEAKFCPVGAEPHSKYNTRYL